MTVATKHDPAAWTDEEMATYAQESTHPVPKRPVHNSKKPTLHPDLPVNINTTPDDGSLD